MAITVIDIDTFNGEIVRDNATYTIQDNNLLQNCLWHLAQEVL